MLKIRWVELVWGVTELNTGSLQDSLKCMDLRVYTVSACGIRLISVWN